MALVTARRFRSRLDRASGLRSNDKVLAKTEATNLLASRAPRRVFFVEESGRTPDAVLLDLCLDG